MDRLVCPVVVVLGLLARADAQTRVTSLYTLPAEGTWVEYDWKSLRPGDHLQTGVLRMSVVGHQKVGEVPCCWIELKKADRHGFWGVLFQRRYPAKEADTKRFSSQLSW